MDEKQITVMFGATGAGSISVTRGGEEIPNITSVAVYKTEPGEIPEIEIKMLAPKLTVIDKTPADVEAMEETKLETSKRKPTTAKK